MDSGGHRDYRDLFVCFLPLLWAGRKEITIMKDKILTIVSTVILFVPWTILPLRSFEWALESPVAEIMIACYAVFMILGGMFTFFAYAKVKVQNNWMKACLVINGLYAVGGACALGLMATQNLR